MSAEITRRARNFITANEVSPVVYGSMDGSCVTYRLANGQMFRLHAIDARQAPNPRWAYLEKEMLGDVPAKLERENAELLKRMEREL